MSASLACSALSVALREAVRASRCSFSLCAGSSSVGPADSVTAGLVVVDLEGPSGALSGGESDPGDAAQNPHGRAHQLQHSLSSQIVTLGRAPACDGGGRSLGEGWFSS